MTAAVVHLVLAVSTVAIVAALWVVELVRGSRP